MSVLDSPDLLRDVAWALARNDSAYNSVPEFTRLHPRVREMFLSDAQKALDVVKRHPGVAELLAGAPPRRNS